MTGAGRRALAPVLGISLPRFDALLRAGDLAPPRRKRGRGYLYGLEAAVRDWRTEPRLESLAAADSANPNVFHAVMQSLCEGRVAELSCNPIALRRGRDELTRSRAATREHCGPELADGYKESNWLPTPEGRTFSLTARFYGPQGDLLAGTWHMPEIKLVD